MQKHAYRYTVSLEDESPIVHKFTKKVSMGPIFHYSTNLKVRFAKKASKSTWRLSAEDRKKK